MANKSKKREQRKKRGTKKHRRYAKRGGFSLFGEPAKSTEPTVEPTSEPASAVNEPNFRIVKKNAAAPEAPVESEIRAPEAPVESEAPADKKWWEIWKGGKKSKKRKGDRKRKSESKRKHK